ncbi:MAG: Na+/H+ antiporter subunit E [Candidatus Muiribacteriota bacterium]
MKNIKIYWKYIRILSVSILCFIAWFIFSEEFSFFSFISAVCFSIICAFYAYNIYIDEKELHKSAVVFRADLLIFYIILIFLEGYFATWDLVKLIFTRKYNPGVIRIKTRLKSDVGRTLLANSITMVPGTLSLWMEDKYIYVHWFDYKTKNSLYAGKLIKARLEKMIKRIFQ